MTAREYRTLAWLTVTTAVGAVALCIGFAASRVAKWANRQGGEQRRRPVR